MPHVTDSIGMKGAPRRRDHMAEKIEQGAEQAAKDLRALELSGHTDLNALNRAVLASLRHVVQLYRIAAELRRG